MLSELPVSGTIRSELAEADISLVYVYFWFVLLSTKND